MIFTAKQMQNLQESFTQLIKNQNIRFIALINNMGKSLVSKRQKNIRLYVDQKTAKTMYMQLKLDISMRNELNPQIGPVKFIVAYRKNAEIITIPWKKYLIFISVEPNSNCVSIAKKAIKLLENAI